MGIDWYVWSSDIEASCDVTCTEGDRFSTPDEKTAEIRNRQDETLNHHEDIIENLDRLNNTIAFILKVSTLGLRISFGCDTASLAQA
jgi:hypothetical protein